MGGQAGGSGGEAPRFTSARLPNGGPGLAPGLVG